VFCAGAYSYIPVGGLDAPRLLAEPVEDAPFLAGDAPDLNGRNGTVHGVMARIRFFAFVGRRLSV
jgi:hypothetical protein